MPLPLEVTIADLANIDKPLLNSKLASLSNLNSEELRLLEQAWSTIDVGRRRQIIHRLVELAEDNVELNFDSIFKNCLKDDDAEVRSKAIEGLWENEEPSLIDSLINLLQHDSSEKVQVAAAMALGKFALLAELKKLRSSYTSKISDTLLTVFSDKTKPIEVRRRALESVAPLNLPQVKKAIITAYHSGNARLRISAIYAMGKNCDCSWLSILLKELSEPNAERRYEAAGACGEIGEEEAVPHLAELVNDPDTEVQLAAIRALGKIGGTDAKECLEQCLNNPNAAVSEAAEKALDELLAGEEPFSFRV